MHGKLPTTAALLEHGPLVTEAVTATVGDPAARAARIAQSLQQLWSAPLGACLLGTGVCAVQESPGKASPDRKAPVEHLTQEWVGSTTGGPVFSAPLPGLAGHCLVGALVQSRGSRQGIVALACPQKGSAEDPVVSSFLRATADHLGLLLRVEELERGGSAVQASEVLHHFPDIAYAVAHEFNNLLNNILLQMAIMEQTGAAAGSMQALTYIREAGGHAAAMVRHMQRLSQQQVPPPGPVDLNSAVTAALARYQAQAGRPPVRAELAPGLPAVLGDETTLGDLVLTLLDSAAGPTPPGGEIRVQTVPQNGRVLLRVEDVGEGVPPELLPRLFEPFAVTRPGGTSTDLTLCKALTRRLRGTIQGENRTGKGMVFVVELRAA